MRVMLVGGGTGGHFYPLIAIVESLIKSDEQSPELYFIGPDPYNKELLQKYNIRFLWCPAGKRRRYFSLLNIPDFFKNILGILVALWKLFVIYPDVVMSKGGYTSVPVVVAAWLLRIPIIIHESDAVPGRANKLAKHFARYIAISYDDAAEFFPKNKTALIGIPIRNELRTASTTDSRMTLGITDDAPLVLVLGGSQGAERINTLILDSLDELLPSYNVIHQTGEAGHQPVVEMAQSLLKSEIAHRYRPVPFLDASVLHSAMTVADIIISRAGSTSIHEIAMHGKPSILIPIPEEISHDQRTNAYAYARTGAATVLEEKNLTDGLLAAEISRIMSDRGMYDEMSAAARTFSSPDASEKLAGVIYEIGREHE